MFGFAKKRAPAPRAVTRLTFAYQGDSIRLVKRQDMKMRLPPSASLESVANRSGFWATLEDVSGRPLYRRVLGNPLAGLEIFQDTPAESIARVTPQQPKGVFTVLVPTPVAAASLVLHGPSAAQPLAVGRAAVEIARFALGPDGKER